MAAPICATSLADPSRSSRAISDACRLAGTASAGDGMAADSLLCCALTSRFQYGFGHFLHEQRNTVRALNDVLPDARRNELVADNIVDHRLDVALRQPIEGESSHVRSPNPGRIELWTERHNQQHT